MYLIFSVRTGNVHDRVFFDKNTADELVNQFNDTPDICLHESCHYEVISLEDLIDKYIIVPRNIVNVGVTLIQPNRPDPFIREGKDIYDVNKLWVICDISKTNIHSKIYSQLNHAKFVAAKYDKDYEGIIRALSLKDIIYFTPPHDLTIENIKQVYQGILAFYDYHCDDSSFKNRGGINHTSFHRDGSSPRDYMEKGCDMERLYAISEKIYGK